MRRIPNIYGWNDKEKKELKPIYLKEVMDMVEYLLYDKPPLRLCDIYREINSSKHYIYEAILNLRLEGRISTASFELKDELMLQDMRAYYTSNPKYHRRW